MMNITNRILVCLFSSLLFELLLPILVFFSLHQLLFHLPSILIIRIPWISIPIPMECFYKLFIIFSRLKKSWVHFNCSRILTSKKQKRTQLWELDTKSTYKDRPWTHKSTQSVELSFFSSWLFQNHLKNELFNAWMVVWLA